MNDREYVHLANSDNFFTSYRSWLYDQHCRDPRLARAFFEYIAHQFPEGKQWQERLADEYKLILDG